MDTLSYKTLSSNKLSANKQWFLIDAEGQNLGRFSSKIAKILRGKYKTNFTPHADCGDNVVILNASKIVMTGDKKFWPLKPNPAKSANISMNFLYISMQFIDSGFTESGEMYWPKP